MRSPAIVQPLFLSPCRVLFAMMRSWLVSGGVAKKTARAARYSRYVSMVIGR